MKKFLESLFLVCFHEYEILEAIDIMRINSLIENSPQYKKLLIETNQLPNKYKFPIGKTYILKCKKCGKLKRQDIYY